MSLLRFCYFFTLYDAQASSACSALIFFMSVEIICVMEYDNSKHNGQSEHLHRKISSVSAFLRFFMIGSVCPLIRDF